MSATMTASAANAMLNSAAAFGAIHQRSSRHSVASAAKQAFDTTAVEQMSLDSRNLLNGNKVVTITHNGVLYRLQATKLGKLILTK